MKLTGICRRCPMVKEARTGSSTQRTRPGTAWAWIHQTLIRLVSSMTKRAWNQVFCFYSCPGHFGYLQPSPERTLQEVHKPFQQKSDGRTSYVMTESQTRGSAANLWNWGNKTFRWYNVTGTDFTSGTKTWHISMACLASSLTSSLSTPDAQGSSSKYSTCHIRSVCENW